MGEYAKEAMKDNASWAKSIREEEARIEVAGGPDRLRRGRVGVLEERMRGLMERFIDDYDRRMDEARVDPQKDTGAITWGRKKWDEEISNLRGN